MEQALQKTQPTQQMQHTQQKRHLELVLTEDDIKNFVENLKFIKPSDLPIIWKQITTGATKEEFWIFVLQCDKMKLDPVKKQIYWSKYKEHNTGKYKCSIIVGIDGYRAIAARTGLYMGNSHFTHTYDQNGNLKTSAVSIYKNMNGQKAEFNVEIFFSEYYPGEKKGFMWRSKPHVMLDKCAEARALRMAFPEDLGGTYIAEELEQSGVVINMDQNAARQFENPDVSELNQLPGIEA